MPLQEVEITPARKVSKYCAACLLDRMEEGESKEATAELENQIVKKREINMKIRVKEKVK